MKKLTSIIVGIYKITSPNKRIYIGQSVDINRRFKEHRLYNKNQKTKLKKSFDKYGVDKHEFEILHECEVSDLNRLERYYQDLFNCMSQKYGLNCMATKTNDRSGYYTKETKLKMSISAKGRFFSDELREKLSNLKIGVTSGSQNGFFGKKHSEKSRLQISNTHKSMGYKPKPRFGNKNNKSKMLLNTYTGIFYDTITEASFIVKIKRSTLSAMLTGQNNNKTFLKYV